MTFTVFLVIYDEYDTYTHRDGIGVCIDSLGLLGGDVSLVIVNNSDVARCPRTSSFLRNVARHRANTHLVETGKNLGCAGGFNRGYESAAVSTDVLIYMSPDAQVVDQETLRCISDVFERYPEIGMAHPVSTYEDSSKYNYSREYSSARFFGRVRFYERDGALATACDDSVLIEEILCKVKIRPVKPVFPTISVPLTFLAIRRELYELLQGFDGNFFVGGENIDFTLRALQKGYYASVVNNTYVHHRRLFFKSLGSGGENNKIAVDGQAILHDYWMKKWKVGWEDIYGEQIYGSRLYRYAIKPYRKLRNRVAAAIRHGDAAGSTDKA